MEKNHEMEQCIQNCNDCYRICLEILIYCLQKGGSHADPKHIQLLLDCVELCRTSKHFMIEGSELHPDVCRVCAEACRRCAESCEKMSDDEQMRKCAQICRKCEASCNLMAGEKNVTG